ncbi:MAG: hypothetical protein M1476_01250 [Candidatus Thermoplasmatota archaeon]|nr:hypothetical protein [Candidatus Thermoplasmatota archaeon]
MNGKRYRNPLLAKTQRDEEYEKKLYSKEKSLHPDKNLEILLDNEK